MNKITLFILALAMAGFSCHLEELPEIITCATPPVAAFSPSSTSCVAPCALSVTNNSQNATGYKWDFGDGSTSSLANPDHTYIAVGNFVIMLVATNSEGCADTVTQTINISNGFPTPVSAYSADVANNEGFAPCNVKFTNASSDAASYEWDFGDGTPVSTETNPFHTYALPDDYIVKLTATGPGGSDVETKTVTIKAITFKKTFGTAANESGADVIQTADGGYALIGSVSDPSNGFSQVYHLQTDYKGNVSWQTTWQTISSGPAYGTGIDEAPDGQHMLFGYADVDGVYLLKTLDEPSSGILNGGGIYPGLGHASAAEMAKTTDGGYILLGSTYDGTDISLSRIYLIKTNANGNGVWSRIYGGQHRGGNSVRQTSDGGYIIVGDTIHPSSLEEDFYLFKTDAAGNVLWEKTYGTSGINDYGNSVIQTIDGGYILLGSSGNLIGTPRPDMTLIKTDASGNEVWKKSFGGALTEAGIDVVQTSDGGYILLGTTDSEGAGSTDIYLIKTDNAGNQVWKKTFGGNQFDRCTSIRQTTDGGFIMLGLTASEGAGGNDFFLIKTDKNGNVQ